MEFDDLNDAILGEFGESVTYRQLAHPDQSCMAIWTDEIPESSQPGVLGRVDIAVSHLSVTPDGGDLVIRGTDTYRVVEPVVKEYGLWKLQVRK